MNMWSITYLWLLMAAWPRQVHKQVTAHFPYCFACCGWPCPFFLSPLNTHTNEFRGAPREKLHEYVWTAQSGVGSLYCMGCECKIPEAVWRSMTFQTVILYSWGNKSVHRCNSSVLQTVCLGETMEPQCSLARHPDRKWPVIGGEEEANRNCFPVNC